MKFCKALNFHKLVYKITIMLFYYIISFCHLFSCRPLRPPPSKCSPWCRPLQIPGIPFPSRQTHRPSCRPACRIPLPAPVPPTVLSWPYFGCTNPIEHRTVPCNSWLFSPPLPSIQPSPLWILWILFFLALLSEQGLRELKNVQRPINVPNR